MFLGDFCNDVAGARGNLLFLSRKILEGLLRQRGSEGLCSTGFTPALFQALIPHLRLFLKGRFSTVWTLQCYHHIAMVTRQVLSVTAHTEWKGEMTAMGCQTKAALCLWSVKNAELWLLCTPATTQNIEKHPKNRNIFKKPQTIHRCQLPVYSVCYLNLITYCLVNIRGKKSPKLPSLHLFWILQLCYQALLGYACYRCKTGAGSFSSSF